MKTLSIDIETYSSVNLGKSGVYRYAESEDFEILLFSYSADHGPIQVIDMACGEEMPENVRRALTDDSVEKWAFNAQFERVCLSAWFRRNHPEEVKELNKKDKSLRGFLNPKAWKCSRIWAAYMGMPLSLEDVGALLKLENQKMAEGKELIRYFCGPCKPTKNQRGKNPKPSYPRYDEVATF